jgi:AmmeMemoRadiSam system protein B/AmmeMemoRadiSam system protein A
MMQAVHVSPYGGAWYPGCRTDLELLLDDLFETSTQRTGAWLFPNPHGFVVPHAGLQYSGAVAAAAYRHVRLQQPRRAIIVGFTHKGGPPGVSIPNIDEYETPLGSARIDRDTIQRLSKHRPFQLVAEDRICDHSVEIQLPLLQHAAPHAQVVPLFAGHLDIHDLDAAAEALAASCGPDTIFLVSSDLTHYGRAFGYQPFPADSKISARLAQLDHKLMDATASLDPRFFLDEIEKSRATLCGRSPIALWLRTLVFVTGDEIFQETLDYQTSGDITGDYNHTVSYAALGYFPAQSFWVDASDGSLLLESARETLRGLRATGEHRPIPPCHITPALSRKAPVFVGLHQGQSLLGCVGNRMGCESLAEAVPEMTLRAALDDPRFPTVMAVEGEIDIEISVLSPMKPIHDFRDFRIGRHGATLECGDRQALLLPQVAARRDWDGEQFLSALSVKAGLGTKGYQSPGTRLSVFQAQVLAM